jgi:hypothetical protein
LLVCTTHSQYFVALGNNSAIIHCEYDYVSSFCFNQGGAALLWLWEITMRLRLLLLLLAAAVAATTTAVAAAEAILLLLLLLSLQWILS